MAVIEAGKSMRGNRLLLLIGGLLISCPGHSEARAAMLVMTCHELVQGVPDPDGNQYVLSGDVLENHVFGRVFFLSSSKLTMLTPRSQEGQSTWSKHKVEGHKLYRTVYWKNHKKRIVRIFNQVYDFDAQTVLDDAIVPIRLTHTPTTYRFRGVNRRVAYGRSRPHRIGIPAIAS